MFALCSLFLHHHSSSRISPFVGLTLLYHLACLRFRHCWKNYVCKHPIRRMRTLERRNRSHRNQLSCLSKRAIPFAFASQSQSILLERFGTMFGTLLTFALRRNTLLQGVCLDNVGRPQMTKGSYFDDAMTSIHRCVRNERDTKSSFSIT